MAADNGARVLINGGWYERIVVPVMVSINDFPSTNLAWQLFQLTRFHSSLNSKVGIVFRSARSDAREPLSCGFK